MEEKKERRNEDVRERMEELEVEHKARGADRGIDVADERRPLALSFRSRVVLQHHRVELEVHEGDDHLRGGDERQQERDVARRTEHPEGLNEAWLGG